MKNTVTQQQIDEIIANGKVEIMKLGEKTTLVKFTSKEGFEIIETSSCVSPKNYSEEIGKDICLERIKNKLWAFEGYCLQKELYSASKREEEHDLTCPFCGGTVHIAVCDDEGNIHDEEYEKDPWSGLGYVLIHEEKDVPKTEGCPIATYDDDNSKLGIYIYDTKEEARQVWNKTIGLFGKSE